MQAECAGITTEGQGGAASQIPISKLVKRIHIGALEWKDCNV